ncbi:T3SS effector NleG family protein [Salmonella enterica subsp. enterica]|nr:T3SS effector NleG family protein [Salmonella enterica subsp. enterica]
MILKWQTRVSCSKVYRERLLFSQATIPVDKVDLCSFSPNVDELSCSEDDLTCSFNVNYSLKRRFYETKPRVRYMSIIWMKQQFIQLIIDGPHPLSRFQLSADMIIHKNECVISILQKVIL